MEDIKTTINQQENYELNFQNINENKGTVVIKNRKKISKKSEDLEFKNIKIIDNPVRQLPKLINELLEKNFEIILTKNGYYVEGFYGLHSGYKIGYAFGQETTEQNTLVFYDAKGHKHLIKSFEDLVRFNGKVWGSFYKLNNGCDYKKPNPKWFNYMLELDILNITPGDK